LASDSLLVIEVGIGIVFFDRIPFDPDGVILSPATVD
jgi:hypothetical protein